MSLLEFVAAVSKSKLPQGSLSGFGSLTLMRQPKDIVMKSPRMAGWIDRVMDGLCDGKLTPDTSEGLSVRAVSKYLRIGIDEAHDVCSEVNKIITQFKQSKSKG